MAARKRRRRKKRSLPKIQYRKAVTSLLLLSVAAFTITMIVVYIQTGGVPDTLVTAFYAFAGGEAGFLGLIKYSDNKFSGDPPTGEGGGSDDTAAG